MERPRRMSGESCRSDSWPPSPCLSSSPHSPPIESSIVAEKRSYPAHNLGSMPSELLSRIFEQLWLTSQELSDADVETTLQRHEEEEDKNDSANISSRLVQSATGQATTIYYRHKAIRDVVRSARQGLLSLCLASRICRNHATIFVYKHLDIRKITVPLHGMSCLMETLFSRQQLCDMVTRLDWTWKDLERNGQRSLCKFVLDEGPHAPVFWRQQTKSTLNMLLLEVFLTKLSNIHELDLRIFWAKDDNRFTALAKYQSPFLTRLKDLTYWDECRCTKGNLDYVFLLMSKTRLTRMCFRDSCVLDDLTLSMEFPQITTAESVEFYGCSFSSTILEKICTALPSVKRFVYMRGDRPYYAEMVEQEAACRELVRVLLTHYPSLETLHIHFNRERVWFLEQLVSINDTIPDLSAFTQLSEIENHRCDLAPTLLGNAEEEPYPTNDMERQHDFSVLPASSLFLSKLPPAIRILRINIIATSILPELEGLPQVMRFDLSA